MQRVRGQKKSLEVIGDKGNPIQESSTSSTWTAADLKKI